jgi:hypothetical protein
MNGRFANAAHTGRRSLCAGPSGLSWKDFLKAVLSSSSLSKKNFLKLDFMVLAPLCRPKISCTKKRRGRYGGHQRRRASRLGSEGYRFAFERDRLAKRSVADERAAR